MKTIRFAAAATAVVLLLTGCSGASNAVPGPSGAVNANPSDSAAGPAAPAGADSPDVIANADAGSGAVRCTVVTKADAQAFMTDPITAATSNAIGSNSDGQQCYFNTDSGGSVGISVFPDSDQVFNYAAELKEFTKPVSVPGIGDRAARDGAEESGAMISVKDAIVCSVTASDENIPGVGKLDLAAGGTNDIGDGNYAVIAAALGTLCNRIYGSGNTTPDLSGLSTIGAGPTATSTSTS